MIRAIIILSAITLSCGGTATQADKPAEPPSPTWQITTEAALTPSQTEQLNRAKAAQGELGKTLMQHLVEAMDDGGPIAAIDVCRDVAGQLTTEVGNAHRLSLGRTSQRLRNPANAAPAWAHDLIQGERTEPALLAAADGRLGVLNPIRLQSKCEMCHGPASAIDNEVKAAIDASYPNDRATDFTNGDLRGWFWVEVPAI